MADEAQLHGGRLLQWRVLPAQLWLAGVHGHTDADMRWRIRLYVRGLRISGVGEHKQPRVSRGDDWVHSDVVVQPELREAAAHQSVFVCGAQSVVGAEWSSEKRPCGAGLCRAALLYSVEPRICPLRPTVRRAKRGLTRRRRRIEKTHEDPFGFAGIAWKAGRASMFDDRIFTTKHCWRLFVAAPMAVVDPLLVVESDKRTNERGERPVFRRRRCD